MLAEGTWYVFSHLDPRWDKTGKAMVGMFIPSKPVYDWIDECEKLYGAYPEDLVIGYMKD